MNRRKDNPSSTSARPLILIIVGVLLMAAAVIWIILNPSQPQAAATQAPTPTNDPNLPFPDIQRVTLDDAKAAFDNQQAVFVDVRSKDSYTISHIPGAINIPVGEMASRAGELKPDDWIITYCT